MAKKTTVKPIALGYREVGSDDSYTPLMGVLKGLSVGQDEPDSTAIEAEFYDSPFDIFYEGNPITMNFELANYDLTELPDLFGGEIDENDAYEGEVSAYTSEWEWKLDFARGYSSLIIVRGLTEATIKKDADGALNYAVTITSLVYRDTTTTPTKELMYKITSPDIVFSDTVKINNEERTVTDGGLITLAQGNLFSDLHIYGEHLDRANPIVIRNDSEASEDHFYPEQGSSTDSRLVFFCGYGESGDDYKVYKNVGDETPWFTISNA